MRNRFSELYALVVFLSLCAGVGYAQGFTPMQNVFVKGTITDSSGVNVASGTITFTPVDNQGHPLSYRFPGAGGGYSQATSRPVSTAIVAGQFGLMLPDTSQTLPVNVCFSVSAIDNVTGAQLLDAHSYKCVQPSSDFSSSGAGYGWCDAGTNGGTAIATCDLYSYTPNDPMLPVTTVGSSAFNGGNVANATAFGSTVTLHADPIANLQAATKQYVDEHSSGAFNGGAVTNPITLPADPTANLQAATKQYVDAHSGAVFSGGMVNGATSFGNTVTLSADPTAALQAATKQYVDAHAGGTFTGGTVSGATTFGSTVTLNADPTANLQAATKQYVDNHAGSGSVTVNGHTGSNVQLAAADVNAAAATDAVSPFANIAKQLIDASHFFFSDGTDGWCAGPQYCSPTVQMYASDFLYTATQNPGYFTAAQLSNVVNKFMAPVSGNNGDIPETIDASGAITINCTSVTSNQFVTGCFHVEGDGWITIPQLIYMYWKKTGDASLYTANVAAIKTALARIPRDPGGNHLIYVAPGDEYVACTGYREQGRFTGDDACASASYAVVVKELATMATAAGDSTNATFFNTELTNIAASFASTFVDPTSHMLLAATIQDNQIDIMSSVYAVYYNDLLGLGLLTGAQESAISTWLVTNYSSYTYDGFVKQMASGCAVVGTIGSNGGSPYGANGTSTSYQCGGYWGFLSGWTAYAIAKTNPTLAGQMVQSFLSAPNPGEEWYATSTFAQSGAPLLMTAGQGAKMASGLYAGYTAPAAGSLCVLDKFGRCSTSGSSFAVETSGDSNVYTALTMNGQNHNATMSGLLSCNGDPSCVADKALYQAVPTGGRVAYLVAGAEVANVSVSGVKTDAFVGIGGTPGLSYTSGTGAALSTGSTNTAGSFMVTSTGALDFTLNFVTPTGGTYSAPHFPSCTFSVAAKNSDTVKFVNSTVSSAEGWGTTSAANEYVTYSCVFF